MRNRTSELRIQLSSVLPLSHENSMVNQADLSNTQDSGQTESANGRGTEGRIQGFKYWVICLLGMQGPMAPVPQPNMVAAGMSPHSTAGFVPHPNFPGVQSFPGQIYTNSQ